MKNKRLFTVIISCLVITSMMLITACSHSYSGTSSKYDTASDYSSDYDSYDEDSDYDSSSDNDEEYDYTEDSDIDSDEDSDNANKPSSNKTYTITNKVTKKTKGSNSVAKTVTKTNKTVTKTYNTVTKTNKEYDNSDWLHKDYYNYKNSIGDTEFGSWYDRAPITRKPYTTFDDIPDSDYLCSVYSGDHYFQLGESEGGSTLVYFKGYTGYLCDSYTISSATYYDHDFSYNAPGVELKKYNNEWVAYKNGPVSDYCGIAPYNGTYWLISRGKVRTDISTIIHVYYDEGNNQKDAYLVIDEGEMVAIKSPNNIVLWSN